MFQLGEHTDLPRRFTKLVVECSERSEECIETTHPNPSGGGDNINYIIFQRMISDYSVVLLG
jgi:hypothetical protein